MEESGMDVEKLILGEVFSYQSGERKYFIQPAVAYCTGEAKTNWEHSEISIFKHGMKTTELFRKTLEVMKDI